MPIDRGAVYEDPLTEYLQARNLGEVTGGGTMQHENGEIEFCDLEIQLKAAPEKTTIHQIITELERLGAPKGSTLLIESTGEKIAFGKNEGIAIYLDGVNLPENVYRECDSNVVFSELKKLTGDASQAERYWQGPTETALYFYGSSFEEMKSKSHGFMSQYPLCQNARVVQVA
ncbi:MAG TPA: hypothetical protein VGD65_24200 [Chryseosolibacter sp.]